MPAQDTRRPARPDERRLTPREMEVHELIARGLTNSAIARTLSVSVHTVKFHLGSIYRKLGVSNRTEAAMALVLRDLALPDTAWVSPGEEAPPVQALSFDSALLDHSPGVGG